MNTSSSVYEPEQDDEAPDHDVARPENRSPALENLAPPLQDLTLASTPASASSNPPAQRGARRSRKKPPKARRNVLRDTSKLPIDRYLELYNESVKDVLKPATFNEASRSSQYGIVRWSDEEKNLFFNALAKKGKDGIREIAALVGTKNEIEIQDYVKLLHRSLGVHHTIDRNVKTVHLSEIPAAFEVSDECNQLLDKVAYAALVRDENDHNILGRRKHQDMWLVDSDVAEYVEDQLESEDRDNTEMNHGIFATASLLNISNWVYLSETIFMNPGPQRLEDNWRHICLEDESPALTCETFSDFYTLAVSLTRRLVQSSIFFALSRLRALKSGGWDRQRVVYRGDVDAAVNVLKMKRDAREFWRRAPRRCALEVKSRINPGQRKSGVLPYDVVEERLSYEGALPDASTVSEPAPVSDGNDTSSSDDGSSDSDSNATSSSDGSPILPSGDYLSDPEEDYASKLDRKADRGEEIQIWKKLDRDPPAYIANRNSLPNPDPDVKVESADEKLPRKPVAKRKTKEELVDWRDHTLYRSEWETRMEEEQLEHRRKRQKIGEAESNV